MSNARRITILDGGMGHELKLRGISDGTFLAGALANQSSSTDSTIVEYIHFDYLNTGCDVITTNSFVAVPQRMIDSGLASNVVQARFHASQLISASVDRARAAVATYNNVIGERHRNTKKIAGCIPPLTECYFSNLVPSSFDHLTSDYTQILSTLLDCNVDILLAETLSTIREAQAILRSLHNIQNQKMEKRIIIPPIWMSFTIHDDQPTMLRSDELLEAACVSIIEEATNLNLPLEAIGVNCSTPRAISKAVPMLTQFTEGANIKVCAYGNCFKTTTSEWINSLGEDCTAEQQTNTADSCSMEYDEEGYMLPEVYAKFACEWAQAGADIIGGCCGSRPMHMKKVVSALKDYR